MDQRDNSGLVPGATPWALTPDSGIEAPQAFNVSGWTPPTFGGDVNNIYPSQEPQQAAPWPRTDQSIVDAFNARPVAAGNDMSRSTPAEGAAPDPGNIPGPWKR